MKPRLPSSPWTREDSAIILRQRCDSWAVVLRTVGLTADIHDADLMYFAEYSRYRTFPVDMPPLELFSAGDVLACGGAILLPVNRERG